MGLRKIQEAVVRSARKQPAPRSGGRGSDLFLGRGWIPSWRDYSAPEGDHLADGCLEREPAYLGPSSRYWRRSFLGWTLRTWALAFLAFFAFTEPVFADRVWDKQPVTVKWTEPPYIATLPPGKYLPLQ